MTHRRAPSAHDGASRRFPVSVKGVVLLDNRVLLLKNERREWELPGGKLDHGETPEECVVREVSEESAIDVRCGSLLDVWVYEVLPDSHVLIVTFGCYPKAGTNQRPVISHEHKEAGLFTAADVPSLPMPDGYKRSIAAWYELGSRRVKR